MARNTIRVAMVSSEFEESKDDSLTASDVSSFKHSDYHEMASSQWHTPYENTSGQSSDYKSVHAISEGPDFDEYADIEEHQEGSASPVKRSIVNQRLIPQLNKKESPFSANKIRVSLILKEKLHLQKLLKLQTNQGRTMTQSLKLSRV